MKIFTSVCFWWFLVTIGLISWVLTLQGIGIWIITIRLEYVAYYLACKAALTLILKYIKNKEVKDKNENN